VVYTAEGDKYKAVIEGVDGSGKPTHNEWTGKFDGKDYPVTGDPNVDTRSIQKVDDHHYKVVTRRMVRSLRPAPSSSRRMAKHAR
jgi:hypothetical protein